MKVLVAVASRHGSTREIARAITEHLRAEHLDVDQRDAREVTDLGGYDAVVLGAPDPQPHDDPTRLAGPMGAVDVRDHRVFVGKLDPSQLGLGERLAVKLVRAPKGDFRDWEDIRGWARGIAAALRPGVRGARSAAHSPMPVTPENTVQTKESGEQVPPP